MKESGVLVCESQYLSRMGIKTIIDQSPFYKVTGEANSSEELEVILSKNKYDIITLDFSEEGKFGPEAISLIQEASPEAKILIISDEENKRSIYNVLARGINHYITKNCRQDEIYKALDACRHNEKYYCPKILDIIIDKTFGQDSSEKDQLTVREREVVKLIAQGKVAKEISSILNISVHTIYTHRKRAMKKLNISSPVELVTYAFNTGLVELNNKAIHTKKNDKPLAEKH